MKDRHLLFIIAMGLTLIGVIMVFSSTGVYADYEYKNSLFFLIKEVIWLIAGMFGLYACYNVNLDTIKKYAPIIFIVTFILVCITYTPLGVKVGGAKRWIRIAGFNFQPSEFLKLALIIMIARYVSDRGEKIKDLFKGFFAGLFFIFISVSAVLGQPDFGTSFLMAVVGVSLLFIGGVKIRYLFSIALSSIPLLYYFIIFFPYRLKRVVTFIDPWKDPLGDGFQVIQSFLAIGKGKLYGVGLGESTQKLFYLPAAHTDFIFSIIAEEFGFIGSSFVVFLFIFLLNVCWIIALRAKNVFQFLLALGCSLYICLQAVFNIAVVTGLVPTKGIPLPFISFGGSSLLLNLMFVGIIMNISKYSETIKETVKEQVPKRLPTKLRFQMSNSRIRRTVYM